MSTERILFLPVSGPNGAGEYIRSLCLAQNLRDRWLSADIRFVVSEQAPYAHRVPFRTYLTPTSPTLHVRQVNQILSEFRPDVVIFDCSGRVAQLRCAKSLGCRTVFISHHDRKRSRGFRIRRMPYIDEHWIIHPNPDTAILTTSERVKLRLIDGPQITFIGAVFEPPKQSLLALPPAPFFLVCAGGGGHLINGRSSSQYFADAAHEIAQRTGMHGLVVLGPTFSGTAPVADNLTVVRSVANGELSWLLKHAEFSVVGGGSLLMQALALEVPVIAVPLASDQAERIRFFVAKRACLPATIRNMAEVAIKQFDRHDVRAELRERAREANVAQGLQTAIGRFGNFMHAPDPILSS